MQDPTVGCTLSYPSEWPGLRRLDAAPEGALEKLKVHPGVWSFMDGKRPKRDGWFVPRSLMDMGRLGAELNDYPPCPHAVTPSGYPLYDHQARGTSFLRSITPEREGAVLGGEMGIGKTVCALQASMLDGYMEQAGLVIAPKLGRDTWCGPDSDARRHYGLDIVPLEGEKNIDPSVLQTDKPTWFFIHYDILPAWQPWLFAYLKFKTLIIDEIHTVTNKGTSRAKATAELSKASFIDRRMGLTGTPITNERLDLWHQLNVVQPRQWGTHPHDFGVRYCGGRRLTPEEGGHWVYDDLSNDIELRARLAGSLLIYTKEELAESQDLPKLKRHIHTLTFDNMDPEQVTEYKKARGDIIPYLQGKKQAVDQKTITIGSTTVNLTNNDLKPGNIELVIQNVLVGLLSRMKEGPAMGAVFEIMRKHSHLVVFTWRVDTAKSIAAKLQRLYDGGTKIAGKLRKPFLVHGKITHKKRLALASQFAGCETGIFVSTLDAIEVSLNKLKRADAALFTDLFWNTKKLSQGEGRVHRLGNPNAEVDSYFLALRESEDDKMIAKLMQKVTASTSLHEHDTIGVSMVRDLAPLGHEKGSDIDSMCASLAAMDAEEELFADYDDGASTYGLDDVEADHEHEYNDEGVCDVCGALHPGAADGTFRLLPGELADEDRAFLESFTNLPAKS
jgi:hypothetical protein